MSLIPIGISIAEAAALELISSVLGSRARAIGPMIADVTIEEHHVDEMIITEHPIEQGAPVTDHAYLRPAVVTIRVGWSSSSATALGAPFFINGVYTAFRALQQSRIPFPVFTGKRLYQKMLVQRLSVTTDERSENALICTAECRQVIITNTQTVMLPDASVMASPQGTAPVQNLGNGQLIPTGVGHA
jgi:hypothetical protein